MAITFKTEGIILKSKDYKEADRLYTILTKNHGKLVVRAQGVKKINSKLAGHLEPITKTALFIVGTKSFSKIGGATITQSYRHLKKDIKKINSLNNCFAIIDNLILEGQQDQDVYRLTENLLSWCDGHAINSLIIFSFIFKLFNLLGVKPDYSKSSGDLAKVLHFLSVAPWEKIQKLRLSADLWQQLTAIFNNFVKLHLSPNLQKRNFLL
jgi:DNA repair protein RecO (recombination protein O)